MADPPYKYITTHSENTMLAGVATLGWTVERPAMPFGGRCVVLTAPNGRSGWRGAFGSFAFLHSVGVIDLKRELDAMDLRDVEQGVAAWREARRAPARR